MGGFRMSESESQWANRKTVPIGEFARSVDAAWPPVGNAA
jgi:hypothetical protein